MRRAAGALPVLVDPAELEMVLTNLVINALDAMPDGGEDGADALAQIDRGLEVDLVLSDVVMPRVTGPELERALRGRGLETPVLLMTGFAEAATLPPEHVERVLRKPLAPRELLEALEAALPQT